MNRKKTNSDQEIDREKELRKLGNRIKQLRIRNGYSNYETFAFEHNINRAQLGRYERGEDMRYSSFLKVIHALGVTQQEFFSEGFGEDNE